jgi:acyl-CoA reductase-like NAD-dependent aldehyde dehydrogenase
MQQVPARVAGRPVTADRWLSVRNPYGGAELARVPLLDADHVDLACRTAAELHASFDRATVLDTAAGLLTDRTAEFAYTIVTEAGKPAAAARREVEQSVHALRSAASDVRRMAGELMPPDLAGRLGFTLYEPLGPVAAVTGYQLPLALVAERLGPAIAAGCPVLLKPSAKTPLSAIRLVDLLVEAGLPDPWVSVLTGDSCTGSALAAHPVVRLVSFAGSQTTAGAMPTGSALDVAGVCPVVVEPDADLDDAVGAVLRGGFGYAGQHWSASRRILVHADVYERFLELLAYGAAGLVVGDPADPATDLGPVISADHARRVRDGLVAARAAGTSIVGGSLVDGPAPAAADGSLVPLLSPAIVDSPALDVLSHPGPVISVTPYSDLTGALTSASRVAVFTQNIRTALRAARELHSSSVLVNAVPDDGPVSAAVQNPTTVSMTERRFVLLAG